MTKRTQMAPATAPCQHTGGTLVKQRQQQDAATAPQQQLGGER
jgi:hypothetical protein